MGSADDCTGIKVAANPGGTWLTKFLNTCWLGATQHGMLLHGGSRTYPFQELGLDTFRNDAVRNHSIGLAPRTGGHAGRCLNRRLSTCRVDRHDPLTVRVWTEHAAWARLGRIRLSILTMFPGMPGMPGGPGAPGGGAFDFAALQQALNVRAWTDFHARVHWVQIRWTQLNPMRIL